jgi:acetyl esterase/lipase
MGPGMLHQTPSRRLMFHAALLCAVLTCHCLADETAPKTPGPGNVTKQSAPPQKKARESAPPEPTIESISYGSHPSQVMTLWKAPSKAPTPLLFYIHGGGWQGGNRMAGMASWVPAMHKAGISVVSIEYRFIEAAIADGVTPPVKACLHDAARALQFVRSQATEWNIDKTKIAAAGSSAGACSSLWLAFHDDLADPQSSDPVARESSRLLCAAVSGAQTTLDPVQMQAWIPNSTYGSHAFGIFKTVDGKKQRDFAMFLQKRDEILPWIEEYSPFHLVSKDDPPVYLFYTAPPAKGVAAKDPTHSANFGLLLQEKLHALGVTCELSYPGAPNTSHDTAIACIIARLRN